MKSNILKSILLLAFSTALFTSCASDDYGVPSVVIPEPNITVNKTVEDIKNAATTVATEYTADDIIEGIVVSSDKGGNFYKKMYLISLDGQIGFSVAINRTYLYNDYEPGRKVYIKLKGLYTQMSHKTLSIGALYNGNVGQIGVYEYRNHVVRSSTVEPQAEYLNKFTLEEAINDENLGKLIQLQNVQFANSALGQNYYNPQNVLGGETNHLIVDSGSETRRLIFRTGQYANYGGFPVSDKSGTITGVLTKFNNDYQFIARYTQDINLTEPRFSN